MKTLSLTKKILYGVCFILILNLLSWLFFGKNDSILLAGRQLEDHKINYSSFLKSISVVHLKGGDDLPWYYSVYNDYSISKQNELVEVIQKNNTIVKGINDVDNPSFDNAEYSFSIISGFPCYSKIDTSLLIGPGSTAYEGYYFYFFGWHQFIIHLRGIS